MAGRESEPVCTLGGVGAIEEARALVVSGGPAQSPGGLGWWRAFAGLLRFELLHLRCSRGLWGWVAVLGLFLLVGTQTGNAGFGSASTAVFVLSISTPLMCVNDLDAGTLKNVLVGRHRRSAYVAVMMVLAALLSGALPGAPALVAAVAAIALFTGLSLWAMARRDVSVCAE